MAYKVLTDGNGSGFIRVVGLGDYMPLKEHQSMVAEIEHKSKLLADVMAERDDLAAQLVAVKEGGGTGQSPCTKFCESVALSKDFDQLREHADKLKVERDALAAENANLKSEIRQRELIHVGFTNGHQVTYVTEQKLDGSFYPDSDNECYVPLYMLNIHSHRVGHDSEVYKEHCERWKFRKEIAEVRAEAIEKFCKSLDGLAIDQTPTNDDCSEDMVIGWKAGNVDCRIAGMKYAAKVRHGGE